MEHAIRKHCKVNLEKDPVLYQRFSEKLDQLIQKHKDDWEQLCLELSSLKHEIEEGRKDDTQVGLSSGEAPFYAIICKQAFGQEECPDGNREKLIELVKKVIESLQHTVGIVNFWSRPVDVSTLKGELSDFFMLSGIQELEDQADKIVTDVVALAKARHQELMQSNGEV